MAQPKPPSPALQLVAIFSQHANALDWARQRIEVAWGPVGLASPRYEHRETTYYAQQMGVALQKQFLVLLSTYDAARLADDKLASNSWEEELAQADTYPVDRPVNIDPGYLTLTKLILASAKDRAHRIYLRDGIYAEECFVLSWQALALTALTYPDYQRADFQAFFSKARDFLKQNSGERTSAAVEERP